MALSGCVVSGSSDLELSSHTAACRRKCSAPARAAQAVGSMKYTTIAGAETSTAAPNAAPVMDDRVVEDVGEGLLESVVLTIGGEVEEQLLEASVGPSEAARSSLSPTPPPRAATPARSGGAAATSTRPSPDRLTAMAASARPRRR